MKPEERHHAYDTKEGQTLQQAKNEKMNIEYIRANMSQREIDEFFRDNPHTTLSRLANKIKMEKLKIDFRNKNKNKNK